MLKCRHWKTNNTHENIFPPRMNVLRMKAYDFGNVSHLPNICVCAPVCVYVPVAYTHCHARSTIQTPASDEQMVKRTLVISDLFNFVCVIVYFIHTPVCRNRF